MLCNISSAYADNVLFHIVDPIVSLPKLMEELSAYCQVSIFWINYAKSEILPITVPSLSPGRPMRYLGVHLKDNLDTLYICNYLSLL